MYALTLNSRKQLERASLRAQAQKPRIEEVEFGVYNVWSTDPKKPGKFYIAGIQPAEKGGWEVTCGCPTQNAFCKHVAAVMPHYLMRVREMEQDRQAQEAMKCECGRSGYAFFDGKWHCIECVKAAAAKEEADAALSALVPYGYMMVNGVLVQSSQELDREIADMLAESADRDCPACGLVQPDDDSTDCWCCGATLDLADVDQELDPTNPVPAPTRTAITFQGALFFLEDLSGSEFEELYDRVVDHGCDLVERAENWTATQWAERRQGYEQQYAANGFLLEHLEREEVRRRTGQAAPHPTECAGCSQVRGDYRRLLPVAA